MKYRIVFLIVFVGFLNHCYAQVDVSNNSGGKINDATEYLFDSKKMKINTIGLFFSPELGVSTLDKKTAPLAGGSFMVLFNKKFGVGFAGQITGNPNNQKELLNIGYGGIKLEYTIKPNSKVHASIPLIIGTGFANNDTLNYRYGGPSYIRRGTNHDGPNFNHSNSQFFILQLGVNLETNLFRFMKIFGGVNYRIATKLENGRIINAGSEIKASQVSGITATIGLKFGFYELPVHKKDSLSKRKK
ncbi:MAG: hypothetical protein V4683_18415 [Bacteroidota bacterium]